MSQEMRDLQEFGFFKIRFFSFWYVCMLEWLALLPGRVFHMLFLKAVDGKKDPSWDEKRKMNVVKKEDMLFELVCGPIRKVLGRLGLTDGKRDVGVLALLKSMGRAARRPVFQGYHADMSPLFEWKDDFGLSIITAGTNPAQLDIYVGSFDGRTGKLPVRVNLDPGESIVFNGLARHRGVCFPRLNLRFFVSFVVRGAMELAEKHKEDAETNNLERELCSEGGEPRCFEEWRQSF